MSQLEFGGFLKLVYISKMVEEEEEAYERSDL